MLAFFSHPQSRHYSSEEDLDGIDFGSSPYILTPQPQNPRHQDAQFSSSVPVRRVRERLDFNNPTETAQKRAGQREEVSGDKENRSPIKRGTVICRGDSVEQEAKQVSYHILIFQHLKKICIPMFKY